MKIENGIDTINDNFTDLLMNHDFEVCYNDEIYHE